MLACCDQARRYTMQVMSALLLTCIAPNLVAAISHDTTAVWMRQDMTATDDACVDVAEMVFVVERVARRRCQRRPSTCAQDPVACLSSPDKESPARTSTRPQSPEVLTPP